MVRRTLRIFQFDVWSIVFFIYLTDIMVGRHLLQLWSNTNRDRFVGDIKLA